MFIYIYDKCFNQDSDNLTITDCTYNFSGPQAKCLLVSVDIHVFSTAHYSVLDHGLPKFISNGNDFDSMKRLDLQTININKEISSMYTTSMIFLDCISLFCV